MNDLVEIVKALQAGGYPVVIGLVLYVVLKPLVVHIDLYEDMRKQRDAALDKADRAADAALVNLERTIRLGQDVSSRRP